MKRAKFPSKSCKKETKKQNKDNEKTIDILGHKHTNPVYIVKMYNTL